MPPSFCARMATYASWMAYASSRLRGASALGSGAKRSRRWCASKRCFAASWVDMAARGAFPLAPIECLEKRREVGNDVLHVHFDAVHERPALRAIPFEAVVDVARAHLLHHHADRARRALRRMPAARRDQEDLAFADRDVARLSTFDHLEDHVAAQLVEELLVRIVVVVGARIRAADHLHDEVLGLAEHHLIADRRLEKVLMLLDPAREIERAQHRIRRRTSR